MTIPDGNKQDRPYFNIARDSQSGRRRVTVHNVTKEQQEAIYKQLSLLKIDSTPQKVSLAQNNQCILIEVTSPQDEELVCRALNQQKVDKDSVQVAVEKLNTQLNKEIPAQLTRALTRGLASKQGNVPTQVAQDRERMLAWEVVGIGAEGRTIIDKPPGALIEEGVLQTECAKGASYQLALLACTQVSANPGAYIPTKLQTDFMDQHSDLCTLQMRPAGAEGVYTEIIVREFPLAPGEKHPRWRLNYAGGWGIQAKEQQLPLATGSMRYQCDLVLTEKKNGPPVVEVKNFSAQCAVAFETRTEENAELIDAIQSTFLSMNLS